MTLVHPIYICIIDTELLLIGQDLLGRLAPLIDRGLIWAQVDTPKPLGSGSHPPASDGQVPIIQESRSPLLMIMPLPEPESGSESSMPSLRAQPSSDRSSTLKDHESFLCSLENVNPSLYSPHVVGGVHINGVLTPKALVALWSEKSAIKLFRPFSLPRGEAVSTPERGEQSAPQRGEDDV